MVRINYLAKERIENPIFEVWFHTADGIEYAAHTTDWDKYSCDHIEGEGHMDLIIDPICLMPGKYTFSVAITAPDGITRYAWHLKRYWLTVESGRYAHGVVFLPHEWQLETNHASPNGTSAVAKVELDRGDSNQSSMPGASKRGY